MRRTLIRRAQAAQERRAETCVRLTLTPKRMRTRGLTHTLFMCLSLSLSSALTLTVCGRSAVASAVDAVVGASRLTLIALTHEMPFNLRAGLTRRSPQRSLTVVKRSFNASAFVSLSLSLPLLLLVLSWQLAIFQCEQLKMRLKCDQCCQIMSAP